MHNVLETYLYCKTLSDIGELQDYQYLVGSQYHNKHNGLRSR